MAVVPRYGILDLRNTEYWQIKLGEIGEDRLFQALQAQLEMYNQLADELTGNFVFATQDHMTRYGAEGAGEMLPAEEYSTVDVQHIGGGYTLGLPIRKYQYALGWTKDYFRRKTVGEFQAAVDEATRADLRLQIKLIKTALFTKENATFEDRRFGSLAVKRLLNADSDFIPSYDGVDFDGSTHTHYLASAGSSLALADITTIENHLSEHGLIDSMVLYINPAQDAAVRALTGFVPAINPLVLDPLGKYAHVSDVNDWTHIIGRIGRFEVRKRTWVPAGYMFAYSEQGANSRLNPLARRLSDLAEDNSLHIAGENETFPLRTQWMERWTGYGAYNRMNGVCMQISGAGTYTSPTF